MPGLGLCCTREWEVLELISGSGSFRFTSMYQLINHDQCFDKTANIHCEETIVSILCGT